MEQITAKDLLRIQDLTIQEVKAKELFANFSDAQAQEVIDTLISLATIIIKYSEIEY
ncbi:hypothetical protein [Pedobacter aquatilis]|uniref:hypothetical protein n=1 Tax=Pedobacter aquatilis TaxID=351343 RepID=UPI002930D441|nr:hypothetical protein [Pedobacter aquatilis]